ncbi:hypothetical protein JRO89_XS11G0116800 [Xanthoceras sorbifolium]|uniref:OTU domain-containing protein n=1 Tax=Xanthoceras sorbifolium TaxID=99658 RepID=A0ABQ8HFB6_9ROSI|nr:hypothetical protein JRO89_XS11G0116800 [Xanthoceras sorbifolium]
MDVWSLTYKPGTITLKRIQPGKKKKPRTRTIQCCSLKQDLQGQSVAVIGLGKSGRAAARLALARGASVVAIDQNQSLPPLEQDPFFEEVNGLRTVLGHFNAELLEDVDVVVVSPGVPVENYGLSRLLQSGKRVMSELDFAAEVIPSSIKILAVTGTNGKSTVVTFVGQMLDHLGIKVFVGGNLGNPLSEAALQCFPMPSLEPRFQASIVEVSSYQMEIPSKFFCPSVAVVLNLTPDHLERHKSMRNYAVTKCRLLSRLTNTKLGLLPFVDNINSLQDHRSTLNIYNKSLKAGGLVEMPHERNQHLNGAIKGYEFNPAWIGAFPGMKIDMAAKTAYCKVPAIGLSSQLQLGAMKAIGTHNYHNAAVAALSVLGLDIGVDVEALNSTIEILKAPPHRMQIVHKDIHGITWVDDSKATNVEAAYAGLMGLKGQKCVVLLGGLAKFGSSGMLIHKTLVDNGLKIPCIDAANMMDAVNHAMKMAKYGDAIVLSPGCASFDEFRNFEHRGMVFQEYGQRHGCIPKASHAPERTRAKFGYTNMIVSALISTCAKNVIQLSERIQGQMGGSICGVTSRGSSSSCCFHLYSGHSKNNYPGLSVPQTISCPSISGLETFPGNCCGPGFIKPRCHLRSLTIKRFISARVPQKRHLEISLASQSINMRLLVPRQRVLRKIKCSAGPLNWPLGCASASLVFGLLVCYCSSTPAHAEASPEMEDEEDQCDLSYVKYSHGKKVYTDYSVIGIPGDGRCLFRSVAHGACLRAGKPPPTESLQRELADDLRARVVDEFIKRREETEWFVEGDFDTYLSQMRKPNVWGGEPELFIASHVLKMPITVYMYDKDSGGLISIAEYGQEYGTENPIRVLYHGFGHYDALHIPGKKDGRSKL